MSGIKTNYIWQVHSIERRDGVRYVTFCRHKSWSRTYLPTSASWKRLERAICGRFGYRSLDGKSIRVFPAPPKITQRKELEK